jgi:beta-lactamase superfamily II metal-dependent hydrolase
MIPAYLQPDKEAKMFRIEVLPAGHGDSILVTYGPPDAPHYVLIDGGPYYVYRDKKFAERKTLSQRLQKLIDVGSPLELLVITHVDADHIEGAVKLLANKPPSLDIHDVWFNAFPHLAPQPPAVLGPLHGEMLSALIQQEDLRWNAAFGGKAVAVNPDEPVPVAVLPGGLRLTLLSPTPAELAELGKVWEQVLHAEGLDPDSPEEALERLKKSKRLKPYVLAAEERPDVETLAEEPFESDTSEANGSSIAFIAEFEGKRCLFAGDAHSTVLEASVEKLLSEQGRARLPLDAFKIAHHGSKSNLSPDLLELLECQRYLVSTNGNYFDHPDQEAIARIIVHGGDQPALYFNYRCEENAVWDGAILKGDYGYQTVYPQEKQQGLTIDL